MVSLLPVPNHSLVDLNQDSETDREVIIFEPPTEYGWIAQHLPAHSNDMMEVVAPNGQVTLCSE